MIQLARVTTILQNLIVKKTAELIDQEVKILIDSQYKRAIQVLKDNHEGHVKLAELLLEKEVIFSENLEEIFGKRPWDEQRRREKDEAAAKIKNGQKPAAEAEKKNEEKEDKEEISA